MIQLRNLRDKHPEYMFRLDEDKTHIFCRKNHTQRWKLWAPVRPWTHEEVTAARDEGIRQGRVRPSRRIRRKL